MIPLRQFHFKPLVFFLAFSLLILGLPTDGLAYKLNGTESATEGSASGSQTRSDSLDRSLMVVESVPAETELDLESIPNTPKVWRDSLNAADESIQIGLYYYNPGDETKLTRLENILKQKARQDVKVEVIADSTFFGKYPDDLRQLAGQSNIEVRILNLEDRTGGVMHGKYFLVDGQQFYTGSANFSWKSLEHNREVGLAGSDTGLAKSLADIFEVDWKLASRSDTRWNDVKSQLAKNRSDRTDPLDSDTAPWIETTNYSAVTGSPPVLNPPTILWNLDAITKLIRSAEDSIFVDLFQYALTSRYVEKNLHKIDQALREASTRGVQVNLMVSDWVFEYPKTLQLKSLAALPNVTVKYLRFPNHTSGYHSYSRVSHTKMLLVDNSIAWVGSANWQPGYFSNSRNVGIISESPRVTRQLKKFFLTAWTSRYAENLTLTDDPNSPFHH